MEPRVSKRDKKLILTYDLPHRVYCSTIYPVLARNGSTVVIYGHHEGLTILWRGGRVVAKKTGQDKGVDGSDPEIMILDETSELLADQAQRYADHVEEQESEEIHPSIVHSLNVEWPGGVSKIAAPQSQQSFRHQGQGIVAIATRAGGVHLLHFPLDPVPQSQEAEIAKSIVEDAIELESSESYVRSLAVKYIHEYGDQLVIAAASDSLDIWQLPLDADASFGESQHINLAGTTMPATVSFHPAARSHQLLVTDKLGQVNILEWIIASDSEHQGHATRNILTLSTPFEAQSTSTAARPAKKRLLDAQFVLNGRCVMTLLQDGQWGIWDITASTPGRTLEQFVLSGYLESTTTNDALENRTQKRASTLTPMTPNTRKAKSNDLFTAPQPKSAGGPSNGGLSVSRTTSSTGAADESVILWHDDSIYTIPTMQSFWQRSTNRSTALGTLYAPAIARIPGINLFSERITSLSQLSPGTSPSGIGQLKMQRDFVLSTEHRLIILHSQLSQNTFAARLAGSESKDQKLLDDGGLDLGGMDRILSTMDNHRRVGFVN